MVQIFTGILFYVDDFRQNNGNDFFLFAMGYLLDMMKITMENSYVNVVKRVQVVAMGTEQNRRKYKC